MHAKGKKLSINREPKNLMKVLHRRFAGIVGMKCRVPMREFPSNGGMLRITQKVKSPRRRAHNKRASEGFHA